MRLVLLELLELIDGKNVQDAAMWRDVAYDRFEEYVIEALALFRAFCTSRRQCTTSSAHPPLRNGSEAVVELMDDELLFRIAQQADVDAEELIAAAEQAGSAAEQAIVYNEELKAQSDTIASEMEKILGKEETLAVKADRFAPEMEKLSAVRKNLVSQAVTLSAMNKNLGAGAEKLGSMTAILERGI